LIDFDAGMYQQSLTKRRHSRYEPAFAKMVHTQYALLRNAVINLKGYKFSDQDIGRCL